MNLGIKLKILVVEDDPMHSYIIKKMFDKNKIDCDMDMAVNGVEALERIALKEYDIIFMDIRMPIMDGIETMRRMKINSIEGNRPVIVAITASVTRHEVRQYNDEGFDYIIPKPLDYKMIFDIIDSHSKIS